MVTKIKACLLLFTAWPRPRSPVSSGSFNQLRPFQFNKVEVVGVNGGPSMGTGEEGGLPHQPHARHLAECLRVHVTAQLALCLVS